MAGGVNTLLTPDGHISLGKAGMLSVDGRCKAFSGTPTAMCAAKASACWC